IVAGADGHPAGVDQGAQVAGERRLVQGGEPTQVTSTAAGRPALTGDMATWEAIYKVQRNSIKPSSPARASALDLLPPPPRTWPTPWPSSPDRPQHRRWSWPATRVSARRGSC